MLTTMFITSIITWWVLDNYYYSPKIQIKRLWKEIFEIEIQVGEFEKLEMYIDLSGYKDRIKKRENIINALLDLYFDPEEDIDRDYIEDNRP